MKPEHEMAMQALDTFKAALIAKGLDFHAICPPEKWTMEVLTLLVVCIAQQIRQPWKIVAEQVH